jgi:MFS transporter, DHA3 family, macrolide efflux protein
MFSLFKQKHLRNIYISNIISELGDWIALIAVQTWMVFELNASVWQVSMLFTFALLPKLVLSPFAGVLIDKWKREKALMISRGLAIFVSLLFLVTKDINTLIVLTVLLNTLKVVDYPSTTGIIRNIAPEKDMSSALSFSFLISDVMKIAGPLCASGIMALSGNIKIAFIINSFSFLLSFLLISRLPKTVIEKVTGEKKSINGFLSNWAKEMSFSIKHVVKSGTLVYSFVSIFVFLFSMNAIDASVVVFIGDLTKNPEFFALFVSLIGLGGAVGAIITIQLQKKYDKMIFSIFNMMVVGILIGLIPLITSLYIILPLAFIIGMFAPGIIIPLEVLKQTLTDKEISSSIAGFSVSVSGLAQLLGAASAGLLMHLLGAGGAFIVSGVLIFLLSLFGLGLYNVFNKKRNTYKSHVV